MIALAVSHANLGGESYHWGMDDYARKHPSKRWESIVVIPQPLYRPGVLRKYRLSGLIAFLSSPSAASEALGLGVPVVNLSASAAGMAFPSVSADSHGIGKSAAKYFLGRGYRHFAFVAQSTPAAYAEGRGQGFVDAVHAAGAHVAWFGAPLPKARPGVTYASTGSMTAWLANLPKPLAVFAAQDILAEQMKIAAQAARFSVPNQVSILGVDDDPAVRDRAGPISSIRMPRRRIGYEAAAMLDRLMRGQPLRKRLVIVPTGEIVTRASSDAHAIDDEIVLEAMRLIEERARDGTDVSDVVTALPLSRRAIERRFVRVTGGTIKARIQHERVTYATRLLADTTMPVDEIARACGFNDRNRFFVAFRQAKGMSPSAFRAATSGVPTDEMLSS